MNRENKSFCPRCGKECFDRRAQAEKVVYEHKKRNHEKVGGSVYLCEFCGKYHISHYSYSNSKQKKTAYHRRKGLNLFEA